MVLYYTVIKTDKKQLMAASVAEARSGRGAACARRSPSQVNCKQHLSAAQDRRENVYVQVGSNLRQDYTLR